MGNMEVDVPRHDVLQPLQPNAPQHHNRTTDAKSAFELVQLAETDAWQRDGEYILTGYRKASSSLFTSLRSIFNLHNDTVNIVTHAFGALAFSAFPLRAYWSSDSRFQHATSADVFAISTYYALVTTCFAFSAMYNPDSSASHPD
ncbi:hypothetical protein BDV96DRAFT_156509 [Lophiotrema nucula]|uniref:HlyIII-domain-containing protein n=1 Tax=Lophiotrema nucula TaxID=690887 RepID=A0A6A5Z330_9PLEO|nr:hypothetical protein BDV96DRAFT_156509 [Lophiotrema nucula]